jgi:putative tryptophan/tyrosine transport system substrate-binding protein
MRRREFIGVLGGVAAWPVVARGQQPERMRRIGVLMGYAENDPEAQTRLAAFRQGLAAARWQEGSNVRIDVRWSAGDVNRAAFLAKELVALEPDAILANTTSVTAAIQRETKSIPIVFVIVSDPVGSGFVESLPHPGGNITGFLNLEDTLIEKWLELLKEIAPRTKQIGVMFNPQTASYAEYYLRRLQTVAPKLGVNTFTTPVQSDDDIQAIVTKMAGDENSGLIAMTDGFMFVHRKLFIELTKRHKIPAMSFVRAMAVEGGLISYSVDSMDLFARSASYIDRILRGVRPADLPVQAPTKFELVINLKTAKALGLDVPSSLLARADEVIE